MADESVKRVKRLISYRETERDQAGGEVVRSRSHRDRAEKGANEALEVAEQELADITRQVDRPFRAEDMHLALSCLSAAKDEVEEKKAVLGKAQENLDEKTRLLVAAHQRVKQMEALCETLKKRHKDEVRKKEQCEIDDLAITREAAR